jgi:hypothetical protein
VLTQLGAAAVDLVAAGEVEPDAAGGGLSADVDGQLPLGAELKIWRQARDQGPDRVIDLLAGNPLAGADQCVTGTFPHVGQVHRGDPVGHLPRAPQVVALDSRRGLPGLLLPGLVDRADHQAAVPPAPRRGVQAFHREPAHHAHRGGRVPDRVVQQPLDPVRRPVPAMPGDAPPVHPRQLAGQRRHILARLQPRLGPGKARPQQPQQLSPFPQRQPGAYADGSGRL